jgi:hypothetical protein
MYIAAGRLTTHIHLTTLLEPDRRSQRGGTVRGTESGSPIATPTGRGHSTGYATGTTAPRGLQDKGQVIPVRHQSKHTYSSLYIQGSCLHKAETSF